MGFLRDSLGIEQAFLTLSVIVFLWAGGLALLHRWAFAHR
jgi:hypothetical protein